MHTFGNIVFSVSKLMFRWWRWEMNTIIYKFFLLCTSCFYQQKNFSKSKGEKKSNEAGLCSPVSSKQGRGWFSESGITRNEMWRPKI